MRSLTILISFLCLLLVSCDDKTDQEEPSYFRSWQQVMDSDTLRVGTITSPQVFYLYRGEALGYEYRKVVDFADHYGLKLDMHIARSTDSLLMLLDQGLIDLSITPIPLTKSHLELYDFGGIIDTTALVLVQRSAVPDKVTNISELTGQSVWTEYGSAGQMRIHQIEREIGAGIDIHYTDTLGAEELLIKMAREDSMRFAISDETLARLVANYFPILDVSMKVSAPIKYGWAVAQGNQSVKEQLDDFFLESERKAYYMQLKNQNSHLEMYVRNEASKFTVPQAKDGSISAFDHLFKRYAEQLPWNWTLLASIAFQESRFRSDVIGWSGARGLMGIMPLTGRSYGYTKEQLLLPDISVEASVKCLLDTQKMFRRLKDPRQQLYFTLAGYNAGVGHVQDAMRLAKKHNAPDSVWYGGVREYILLKSNPDYYNDPVVKYGYLRGRETVKYVDEVVAREELYNELTENIHSSKKK